ncbi:hypothetical protein DFP72DRAFT_1151279 [Ephemerocybe angulata]|uniref:Uncharacterized protein n=1 Tax=Ephemerocybe angulata TaxID=980116 RepID=A0A8H6IAK4_9AGAR|nr:hypothetical protein DFP72DRAFT_1151279 [Tulosesus angulatus]
MADFALYAGDRRWARQIYSRTGRIATEEVLRTTSWSTRHRRDSILPLLQRKDSLSWPVAGNPRYHLMATVHFDILKQPDPSGASRDSRKEGALSLSTSARARHSTSKSGVASPFLGRAFGLQADASTEKPDRLALYRRLGPPEVWKARIPPPTDRTVHRPLQIKNASTVRRRCPGFSVPGGVLGMLVLTQGCGQAMPLASAVGMRASRRQIQPRKSWNLE